MRKSILTICIMVLAACFITANAQIKTPAPSPSSKVEQKVGLTDVTIEYSRPGMKDREIFGSLVPFGKMWRTGANASTKVSFSDDVKVGGVELKKGKYALYTIPGENEWTIVFYNKTGYWGTPGKEYTMEEDAARFTVKPQTLPMTIETMLFDINNIKSNTADINLMWENTLVSIPVEVEVDSKVMKDIKSAMGGTTRGEYYVAARYYYDNDKDMNQAHEWAVKANELDEKFWQLRLQALIEAKLGKYDTAIATANRSTELAKAADNADYPRMNSNSITEWRGMMKKKINRTPKTNKSRGATGQKLRKESMTKETKN